MKKMALSFAVVSLLLGACSNDTISKKDEVIQKDTKEKSMIPRTAVSKDYYRTVIPLKEQKVINTANITTNSKLDLAEYENGLMNIAKEQFDTENHVLQLNQYIPEKLVDELVAKVKAPVFQIYRPQLKIYQRFSKYIDLPTKIDNDRHVTRWT